MIKRSELIKHITTVNPKTPKNKVIEKNINLILDKFSIVKDSMEIFRSFYGVIIGEDPNKVDDFINENVNKCWIGSFCKGLKNDIEAIKNAITLNLTSGPVEGKNNKFKLIKRMSYGRFNLDNLRIKSMLGFANIEDNKTLLRLVRFDREYDEMLRCI